MISRLMLNLRDPSLLLNGRHGSFITSTGELTYPNLTTVELEYTTQTSEGTPYTGDVLPRPGHSESHSMYH